MVLSCAGSWINRLSKYLARHGHVVVAEVAKSDGWKQQFFRKMGSCFKRAKIILKHNLKPLSNKPCNSQHSVAEVQNTLCNWIPGTKSSAFHKISVIFWTTTSYCFFLSCFISLFEYKSKVSSFFSDNSFFSFFNMRNKQYKVEISEV